MSIFFNFLLKWSYIAIILHFMEWELSFPFLNKVKAHARCCVFAALLFTSSCVFAGEKELVLLVSHNSTSFTALSSAEQQYARSALHSFIGNLTQIDEIAVRTDENDAVLRQIQKKSQLEAAVGLRALEAAYENDAGAKAALYIAFSLVKSASGWKLSYTASDIERQTILFADEASGLSWEQIETETDRLSFSALDNLRRRGFISLIPNRVRVQLLHEEDTEENFRKYIAEYASQALSLQRQLDALQKEAFTAEERVKKEQEEQSLRLKLEIASQKKAQMEEAEKSRKAEAERERNRQTEMAALTEKQRNEFMEKLSVLEGKRTELLKQSVQTLPLKKRIELIETDRKNLSTLKRELEAGVLESNAYYDGEKQKKLAAKMREPWGIADLSGGKPTKEAQNGRKRELAEIAKEWDEKKHAAEKEIRSSVQTALQRYENALAASLAGLEATDFSYTSLDTGERHIQVQVDEYDGAKKNWFVHTTADFSDIPLLRLPYQNMPTVQIRYADMTGMQIPSARDVVAYKEYRERVEWADRYFRTQVPYLYATLSLRVQYDEKKHVYKARYTAFSITKMENQQVIFYSGKGFLGSSAQGKHFMQNQRTRTGIFVDGSFSQSFLYESLLGARLAALWGNSFLFAGLSAGVSKAAYAEKYTVNFEESTDVSVMALCGTSVTFLRVRPYMELGAGFYLTQTDLKDGADSITAPSGFCASIGGGADYFVTPHVTVGVFYAVTYREDLGFTDTYALRAGFNF